MFSIYDATQNSNAFVLSMQLNSSDLDDAVIFHAFDVCIEDMQVKIALVGRYRS
jgi:hypothetical protein